MKRIVLSFSIVILGLAIVGQAGCVWVSELLVNAVANGNEFDDGRDQDVGGLTESDRVARYEEQFIRSAEQQQRFDHWKAAVEREKVAEESQFGQEWEEHVSRSASQGQSH